MSKARTDGEGGGYHAQALIRGITVLRTLAALRAPATLAELSTHTGIPKPTLVRLLAVLTQEGCLVRLDDRPTYELGPTILEIAAGASENVDLEELAKPYLEPLQAEGTANVGVIDGGEALHVAVALANRPVRYAVTVGVRDSIACTGLGKAIAAHASPDARAELIKVARYEKRTPTSISTQKAYAAELDLIRERGWAHDNEEGATGLRCFAMPIMDGDDCVGAVSISGPSAELPLEVSDRIVPLLQKAAAQMGQDNRIVRGLRAIVGVHHN